MAGKKVKSQKYFKLAETQLICGLSEEKKQKIIVHARIALGEHKQRSKIGEHLKNFVSQHGDQIQAQMAQLWGEAISPRTISRGLKKIGFTNMTNSTSRQALSVTTIRQGNK
jgi:hypothetical protein